MAGSKCFGYSKDKWKIIDETKLVPGGKKIYNVVIGEIQGLGLSSPILLWMKKEVYDKVMKDEYVVKLKHYNPRPIDILNLDGESVNFI